MDADTRRDAVRRADVERHVADGHAALARAQRQHVVADAADGGARGAGGAEDLEIVGEQLADREADLTRVVRLDHHLAVGLGV